MTIEEALAASEAEPVTDNDMQFWIDEHLRVISIPKNGVVAGVEGDKNVNKIKFGMNRYYHGFDMSELSGRILYSNAKGNKNYYNITDMQTNGNIITFSWLVDADAVQYMGKTAFVVYLFKTQGSELRQKFYSTLATLNVLEGMEVDSAVPVEKQTDIIERMKEEISAYAEEVKKSLPADYTAMTEQVSSLKEDINNLSDNIDNLSDKKANINNKYGTLYMLSPNGTVYKVKISDNGVLYVDGVASDEEVLDDLISGRILLWNDEFDGESLNTDTWDYELGYVRNNEKQYYTTNSKNIYVSDSILHIVALKDNPTDKYEWSSASIDSQLYKNGTEGAVSGVQRSTGFSYGYGLIEVKARCLTPSAGVWPAFWSRGASQQSEGWPMCGEIDIGELFYNSTESAHRYNPGIFWYDWHKLAQKSQRATDDGLSTGSAVYKTADTDWHYYGMERSETKMIFYFDRKEFCRIDLTELDDSDIQSAMGQPMSVKFNLAMGSSGGEIEEGLERAEYDIDYVRYYASSSIAESTDSGTWDFPDYMPTELAPSKIARIIPERDMTNGKNQYLYWESSDESIATATAGLIKTASGASGEVIVTMHDTFGNSKSAIIAVKDDANCVSEEVREIPTNPSIIPYGETSKIQVRLVPYWVTKHTVTAELNPEVEGVAVSVTEGSHAIAKYMTPCSIISIENNAVITEDTSVNLIITAEDSEKSLTMPLTIESALEPFDTTGMYAAYFYEKMVKSESTVGTIYDATGNNKDPLTNIYYTTSYNNGICRVSGKGIQSQVQSGQFNPSTAEGFFLEEFNPDESRTFVFNIKAGMTETRSAYNMNHGLLSIVHSGIGRYVASNTTDGRHGFSFGYSYSDTSENGYIKNIATVPNGVVNGFTSASSSYKYLNPNNVINPEVDTSEYLHGGNYAYTVFCIYDADNKTLSEYIIVEGKVLACLYNGMSSSSNETYYNKGIYNITTDTSVSEDVLAESETDPFYWRYGNGNQICSDFVRAICVYDRVLSKEEMIEIFERLSNHYA